MRSLWIVVLLGLANLARGAGLDVVVDPRIELLAAVQLLAADGRLTRLEHDYRTSMLEHFGDHARHEAVERYRAMRAHGFSYDAPVATILHYGPPPELAPLGRVPETLAARGGGSDAVDAFIEAMRDFAQVSDFGTFFEGQRELHETLVAAVAPHAEPLDPGLLESYYGETRDGYVIVLAPLFHPGGYGPAVTDAAGRTVIYGVIGPHGVVAGRPTFGDADTMRYLVWHEFSHSFVNPVVDRHAIAFDRLEALHAPLRVVMERQAYGTWRIVVYEHLVRALTTRFAFRELGPAAGRQALVNERRRGFLYIDALVKCLAQYEADRQRYPTLDSFAVELVDALNGIIVEHPEVLVVPRVVRAVPAPGDADVDPDLAEIVVEFDADMEPRDYSWMKSDAGRFPEITGAVRWTSPRTCVLPVRLEPMTRYWIGINTGAGTGFHNALGVPAEPYEIRFETTRLSAP